MLDDLGVRRTRLEQAADEKPGLREVLAPLNWPMRAGQLG
jgi:hypothetical protein